MRKVRERPAVDRYVQLVEHGILLRRIPPTARSSTPAVSVLWMGLTYAVCKSNQ
jgi:hypothetical protein